MLAAFTPARPGALRGDARFAGGGGLARAGLARGQTLGLRYAPVAGRVAERRRKVWPSRQAAFDHFIAKPMFRAWAPGVLDDYLEHGLKPHPDGVQLRFDREVEAAIYSTLPHDMDRILRRPFPVPVGFIAGDDSEELRQAGLGATRKLVGANLVTIPGTHLYPMDAAADGPAHARDDPAPAGPGCARGMQAGRMAAAI
jgi:hypothetical protein